jgi:hypothetical protein
MDQTNKIVLNSKYKNNLNIQNAFVELTNDNHYIENSLYWLNKYIEENNDDEIIKINNLLVVSQANIQKAFIKLNNIIYK